MSGIKNETINSQLSMKKKLLYFMFAAVALCVACGDEDETFQREGVENPVTGISIENEFLEDGVIRI